MNGTKQIHWILNITFITLIAYLGVTIFYNSLLNRLNEAPVKRSAGGPLEIAAAESGNQPFGHYAAIPNRDLFKTDEKETAPPPEPEPEPVVQMEETRLRLTLWGTVTGEGGKARAVIEEKKKRKQDLYEAGDTVEGATIREIRREQVILLVNGKLETLSMEKDRVADGDAPPEPVAEVSSAEPAAPFPGTPSTPSDQRVNLSRATIEGALNNVNDLMKQARIRPHFRNGKPDGLTLSRVQRDSLFTKLGLRSGDIITGVNGDEIKSVDDALGFYESLKSASNLNLQIRRRGKERNIEYSID